MRRGPRFSFSSVHEAHFEMVKYPLSKYQLSGKRKILIVLNGDESMAASLSHRSSLHEPRSHYLHCLHIIDSHTQAHLSVWLDLHN